MTIEATENPTIQQQVDAAEESRVFPSHENPMKDNIVAVFSEDTPVEKRWEIALDAVDYPVNIVPLIWNDGTNEEPKLKAACGLTPKGRLTTFYGIRVDRDRTGDVGIIATVTERYGTLPVKTVYEDFFEDLKPYNPVPRRLYVAENGGMQMFDVDIDVEAVQLASVGKTKMSIQLHTSVDTTARHIVKFVIRDEDGTELVVGSDEEESFSTKHTKTLAKRHQSFKAILHSLIEKWQNEVAPLMMIMDQKQLDAATVKDLIDDITASASIPKSYIDPIVAQVEEKGAMSMLGAVKVISTELQAQFEESPERVTSLRKKANKAMAKTASRYL